MRLYVDWTVLECLQLEHQVLDVLVDMLTTLTHGNVQIDSVGIQLERDSSHFLRDESERRLDEVKHQPVLSLESCFQLLQPS